MKRFLCMLLTVVMVISAVPFSPAFAGAVEEVGPYVGEPDPYIGDLGPYAELFEEPDVNVLSANATRAQVVTVLVGADARNLLNDGNTPLYLNRFHDVRINDWFYPPVAWAYRMGWARGDDTGRWHPDRSVERQEMFAMFVRAFNPPIRHPLPDLTTRFVDGHNVAGLAVPYLQRAVQQGWARGVPIGNGQYELRAFAPTHINDPGWLLHNINPNLPVRFPSVIRTITWHPYVVGAGVTWQRAQGHAIGPLPAATMEPWVFADWWTVAHAGGTRATAATIVSGDLTYWARWRNITLIANVPTVGQEMSMWCWAASSASALRNRGNTVAQRTFVSHVMGPHLPNVGANRDQVVSGLRNWSGGRHANGTAGGVPVATIRAELNVGRPVIVGVSQHMMVVYGLDDEWHTYRVMDPLPVNVGRRGFIRTQDMVSGINWTSTIRF